MSEETTCYSATLWIDGKAAFSCSNRGNGGCDDIHAEGSHTITEVEAYLRDNTPPGVELFEFSSPIESLIIRLIAVADAEKLLKARLRKSFIYIENGTVQALSPARGRKFDEAWATAVAERHPARRRVTATQNWDEAVNIIAAPQA
jgi:hypothetical protein